MQRHLPFAFLAIGLLLAGFGGFRVLNSKPKISQNDVARSKVYTLRSPRGMCTGVSVKAFSGKSYILTAGHCKDLVDIVGNIHAIDESGESYNAKLIIEDPYADLMLLEGQGVEGVVVAGDVDTHQHVWTMTHGHDSPAHRSDGEVLEEIPIQFAINIIETPADIIACQRLPKQSPMITLGPKGLTVICVMSETALGSTAAIQPGSSGGPMFNDKGELVGIASATDGVFSYWVTLTDIRRLLRAY